MQFLGILLTFSGYTLVYAAVANGGKFATEPWAGLFADAYGVGPAIAGAAAASGVTSSSNLLGGSSAQSVTPKTLRLPPALSRILGGIGNRNAP